jgi:proteasome accessory factor B
LVLVRRIERLINLIAALLETARPMTAEDIRREIHGYDDHPTHEAFRRAFERDKESLRNMGIPIEMKPVTEDPFSEHVEGYIIPKDRYYLPELDLEPDEVAALHLAAEVVLGGSEAASAGLKKLSVDPSVSNWSTPRLVWGQDIAAEQPLLVPVYNGVLAKKPLRFVYTNNSGETAERTVEPYGLVHRRGAWYLVGRDVEKDGLRSFKLSSFESAPEMVDGHYEVPAGFDAAAYLEGEPFEIGEVAASALVRFPPALVWFPEQNLARATLTPQEDGSVDVEVPVANPSALASWIASLGPGVEVLGPQEMRGAVVSYVESFLEHHG